MTQAADDVDGIFADVATIGVTTGATVVASRARHAQTGVDTKRERQLALAAQHGAQYRPGFLGRFSRRVDDAMTARDPIPPGYRGTIAQKDWDLLTSGERRSLDPDQIGRHPLDITTHPSTGPTLPPTATQIQLAGRLGQEAGLAAKGVEVSLLTRLGAAQEIQSLEALLPKDVVDQIYVDLDLARRTATESGVAYQFPADLLPQSAPASSTAPADGSAAAATPAVEPAPRKVVVLNDPSTWRSANDPVRPAQRDALVRMGFPLNEIQELNKGWASQVIRAGREHGDVEAHETMDRALAAMERAATVVDTTLPPPPTPGPAPTR